MNFPLQKNDKVSLVVARKTGDGPAIRNLDDVGCSSEASTPTPTAGEATNGHAAPMRNGGSNHRLVHTYDNFTF